MKDYSIIDRHTHVMPDFRNSTLDPNSYFSWFISVKNERLAQLNMRLFGKTDHALSVNNLSEIFRFISEGISVNPRSKSEIEIQMDKYEYRITSAEGSEYPLYQYIEPTYSIIFDAGIFFGELLIAQIPELRWSLEDTNPHIFYGHPVLENESGTNDSCSPAWIVRIFSNKIFEKKVDENDFFSLYSLWKDILLPS